MRLQVHDTLNTPSSRIPGLCMVRRLVFISLQCSKRHAFTGDPVSALIHCPPSAEDQLERLPRPYDTPDTQCPACHQVEDIRSSVTCALRVRFRRFWTPELSSSTYHLWQLVRSNNNIPIWNTARSSVIEHETQCLLTVGIVAGIPGNPLAFQRSGDVSPPPLVRVRPSHAHIVF